VIVHPDGTWTNKDIDTDHPDAKLLLNNRPALKTEERKVSFGAPRPEIVSLDDDDDDQGAPTPASLPPVQSRAVSTSVRPTPAQSPRKRGPPQIVDLTLSDEEDILPVPRRPVEPPSKRMRIDPPAPPSSLTNGVRRVSLTNGISPASTMSMVNGVSPISNSVRDSHIRSPPSSISPRNDTTAFQYQQPPTTDISASSFRLDFPPPPRQLPSPSLLSHPFPTFPPKDPPNEEPRSHSSSPVLPVFAPVLHNRPSNTTTTTTTTTTTATTNNNLTNSTNTLTNLRFDWDSLAPGRPWDSDRDDIENEDLDLEMARLPSSMFDADGRRDLDDDDGY
jgi:hypothetical protein